MPSARPRRSSVAGFREPAVATIPDLANLGDDAEAALAPLDAVIDSLETVRAGLPG